MTTEPRPAFDRLVEYLCAPVAEVIRGWGVGRTDIYGIWLSISLAEDDRSRPQLSSVAALTEGYTTDALVRSYGSRYSDGCSTPETRIDLRLCEETGEWYSDPSVPGDPEGRALRNAFFAERGLLPPDRDLSAPNKERHLIAFLDACGAVIRRLHEEGVITAVCGRPVPIGIVFDNDIDKRIALAVVRDANPAGLARGMEEAIMNMST